MAHKINLDDQWFLNMHRRDPLLGSDFKLGDNVVICVDCRCVQTIDTWEFNGNKCINCGKSRSTSRFSRELIDYNYRKKPADGKENSDFRITKEKIRIGANNAYNWFTSKNINRRYLIIGVVLLIQITALLCLWAYCLKSKIDFWPKVPIELLTFHKEIAFKKLSGSFSKITKIKVISKIDIRYKLHPIKWYAEIFLLKLEKIQRKLRSLRPFPEKVSKMFSNIIRRVGRLLSSLF